MDHPISSTCLVDWSRQQEFDREILIRVDRLNIIVGCGGVGFWLGIILAMQGYKNFILIDKDKLDYSNLNRIPCPQTWVGTNKAVALRKIIRLLRPDCAISTVSINVTVNRLKMFNALNGLMWDCTDNAVIQKELFKYCNTSSERMLYRKIGYEGWDVGTYTNYDVWLPDNYRTGYRTSRACAVSSIMAASLGMLAEGLGVTDDINLNIKNIVRPEVLQEANNE